MYLKKALLCFCVAASTFVSAAPPRVLLTATTTSTTSTSANGPHPTQVTTPSEGLSTPKTSMSSTTSASSAPEVSQSQAPPGSGDGDGGDNESGDDEGGDDESGDDGSGDSGNGDSGNGDSSNGDSDNGDDGSGDSDNSNNDGGSDDDNGDINDPTSGSLSPPFPTPRNSSGLAGSGTAASHLAFPTAHSLHKTAATAHTSASSSATSDPAPSSTAPSPTVPNDPKHPRVTPCQVGAGPNNGCGNCKNDSTIAVQPFGNATLLPFDGSFFPAQAGEVGASVFFSIPQPEPGCMILFFDPFPATVDYPAHGTPGLLTAAVSQSACVPHSVDNGKLGVGSCCHDECEIMGAGLASASSKALSNSHSKRSINMGAPSAPQASASAVPQPAAPQLPQGAPIPSASSVSAPPGGDINALQPPAPLPPAPPRGWTYFSKPDTTSSVATPPKVKDVEKWCEKAIPVPDKPKYTRLGPVQLVGQSMNCKTAPCTSGFDYTVTSSNSIDISASKQDSASLGSSVSGTVGYGLGPTALFTIGFDTSYTSAVTSSSSFTNTSSTSKAYQQTLSVPLHTTAQMAVAAHMICSVLSTQCHDKNGTTFTAQVEMCEPLYTDGNAKQEALHELLTLTLG